MGLFDMGSFAQPGNGWLTALLQNPDFLNQGGIAHSNGFPVAPGQTQAAPLPPAQTIAPAPQPMDAMAQGQMPPPMGVSQMPQQSPGFGDRLGAAFQGFANAGSPMQAIGNLVGGLATGQRSDPMGMALQSQGATMQALVRSGVPPAIAQAAALNPEILKTIAPAYFDTAPKLEKLKNPLGGEDPYLYRAGGNNPTLTPLNTGPGGGGSPGSTVLAPGLSGFDESKTGDARLAQYHPDIQAVAKAYLNGDVIPTGNPRMQGIMPFAKTVATRYASDMGIPFSDETYAKKRKMLTDIAASSNSSMGGILSNGNSAYGHLAQAAEDSVDLGNKSSVIPHLDSIQNYTGNVLLPSSATKGKLSAARDSLGKFGTESTKFYAGTGGGVEERTAALKNNNPDVASGEQMAGFFGAEKRLMLERLDQKEAQIRDTLGEKYLQEHPVRDALFEKNLARIDAAIAKLKGGDATAAPQTNAVQTATGPNGQKLMLKGNQWVPMK